MAAVAGAVVLTAQLLIPVARRAAEAGDPSVLLEQVSKAGPGGPAGNDDSCCPSISADGRWVAYASEASNLDPASADSNGVSDVFVYDRTLGVSVRVSPDPVGPRCSALCTVTKGSFDPSISADGAVVAFVSDLRLVAEDTNNVADVYVRSLPGGPVALLSFDLTGGRQAVGGHSPSVSGDGTAVGFVSSADFGYPRPCRSACPGQPVPPPIGGDLARPEDDVYVRQLGDAVSRPRLVSEAIQAGAGKDARPRAGNGPSEEPSLSSDGRSVAFTSVATDLTSVAENGDAPSVFRRTLQRQRRRRRPLRRRRPRPPP